LHTEASGASVGGILNVVRGTDKLQVVVHTRLLCGQRHHLTTELEALLVVLCLMHFAHYLYECHVLVPFHSL